MVKDFLAGRGGFLRCKLFVQLIAVSGHTTPVCSFHFQELEALNSKWRRKDNTIPNESTCNFEEV